MRSKIWNLGDFAVVCDPVFLHVVKQSAWMINFWCIMLCTFETMKHVSCVFNCLKSGRKYIFQKRKRFYVLRICYFCSSNLFLRYSSDRARSILANVIKCIEYLMSLTPPPFVGVFWTIKQLLPFNFPSKKPLLCGKVKLVKFLQETGFRHNWYF